MPNRKHNTHTHTHSQAHTESHRIDANIWHDMNTST